METEFNKIGILGVGAIGSAISFDLQMNKSHELFYFGRTRREKLRIIVEEDEFELPIKLETSISQSPKLDWLIICLKEYQYSRAKNWFVQLISPETNIAVIGNGLDLKAPVLEFASTEQILECIIDCPTQMLESGFYRQFRKPKITVQDNSLARKFKNLFSRSHSDIKLVLDFRTESWKKVIESSANGSILCLSGETCWILEDDRIRRLYLGLLEEGVQVAQSDGARIDDAFKDDMEAKALSYPKSKGSSMLTDRLNGNPIELGAKNRIICDAGEANGIKTPLNSLIVTLLSNTNKKNSSQHPI